MTGNVRGRLGRWARRPDFTPADAWTAAADGVWTPSHVAAVAEVKS